MYNPCRRRTGSGKLHRQWRKTSRQSPRGSGDTDLPNENTHQASVLRERGSADGQYPAANHALWVLQAPTYGILNMGRQVPIPQYPPDCRNEDMENATRERVDQSCAAPLLGVLILRCGPPRAMCRNLRIPLGSRFAAPGSSVLIPPSHRQTSRSIQTQRRPLTAHLRNATSSSPAGTTEPEPMQYTWDGTTHRI